MRRAAQREHLQPSTMERHSASSFPWLTGCSGIANNISSAGFSSGSGAALPGCWSCWACIVQAAIWAGARLASGQSHRHLPHL